jgi:uncharacterized membrane protein
VASMRFMVVLLKGQSATIPERRRPENCTAGAVQRRTNLMLSDRLGYVAGGAVIIAWALRRPSLARAVAAGLGGWLLYQGYTGSTPVLKPLGIRVNRKPAEADLAETIVVKEAVTIARPREEVYAFWRRRENLPLTDDGDIEITREAAGEELGWRVVRGDKLLRFGSVSLRDAPGGQGTIVGVHVEYVPMGGSLGAALALVAGRSPQRIVTDCLRRARALLETGKLPTS